jgi:maltose/moltooligosaccharide transporter
MFIVLPEIVASLGLGWVMTHLLGDDRLLAVVLGGGCFLVAALLSLRVQETTAPSRQSSLREPQPAPLVPPQWNRRARKQGNLKISLLPNPHGFPP